MMRIWLLRLVVPLVMLMQAVYAMGWAYLLFAWPSDPEVDRAPSAGGTVLFSDVVVAPALMLVCGAVLLAVTAGPGSESVIFRGVVAAEVFTLFSGLASGGFLLSIGAVVVLITLVATWDRTQRTSSGAPVTASPAD